MLLAREALRVDRTKETEGTLLATLLRSPAALATYTLPIDSRPQNIAVAPNGQYFVVTDNTGHLRFYSTRTHRQLRPPTHGFGVPPLGGRVLAGRSPLLASTGLGSKGRRTTSSTPRPCTSCGACSSTRGCARTTAVRTVRHVHARRPNSAVRLRRPGRSLGRPVGSAHGQAGEQVASRRGGNRRRRADRPGARSCGGHRSEHVPLARFAVAAARRRACATRRQGRRRGDHVRRQSRRVRYEGRRHRLRRPPHGQADGRCWRVTSATSRTTPSRRTVDSSSPSVTTRRSSSGTRTRSSRWRS